MDIIPRVSNMNPPGPPGSGFSFSGIIAAIQAVASGLQQLTNVIGSSLISLSGDNIFSGLNSFLKPPVINAGMGGTGTFHPEGIFNAQLSAAGIGNAADITNDVLFSVTLPANSFDSNGRGVVITAFGKTALNGNNKVIRVLFGSSVVFSTGVVTSNGMGWRLSLTVFRTGASSQLATAEGTIGSTVVSTPIPVVGTEDSTLAITLSVTGASSTSGVASDVVGQGFYVTFMD